MAQPAETLNLKDGTTMDLARPADVDDATWSEVKIYLEANPESAKTLQAFARSPDAVRSWMQTQLILSYYNGKKEGDGAPTQDKFKALAEDPELSPFIERLKTGGQEAMFEILKNEELMLKVNAKLGGLPSELGQGLSALAQRSMTLHEAAKKGDMETCKEYITKGNEAGVSFDTPDPNGITALGFAIGADRAEIVKLLISCKANPQAVDAKGNTGVHYAAGYGRKELLELLLSAKSDPSKKNSDGKSPLDVAASNKMEATIEVLKKAGAQ